jgi:NADP-dependent 3-hydroxy acid dehydrogenase YdfG
VPITVQDLADAQNGKPIDVLIHNAGTYPREGQQIGEIDYEGWREAFEINRPAALTRHLGAGVAYKVVCGAPCPVLSVSARYLS